MSCRASLPSVALFVSILVTSLPTRAQQPEPHGWLGTETLKTAVAAERYYVEIRFNARCADRRLTDQDQSAMAQIVTALAAKNDMPEDTVRKILDTKFDNKCKREGV